MDLTRAGLRTRDLDQLGVARARQLSDDWVTSARGIHVPAYAAGSPAHRAVATAVGAVGAGHAIGGWAALTFHTVPYFDHSTYGPNVLVHCLGGAQLRARATIEPFLGRVHADELTRVDGLACTTIARAAFDELRRRRTLEDAVVVADMAVSHITDGGRTSIAALSDVIAAHPKIRGVVQARRALTLSSQRSGSPWETRLRLRATLDVGMQVRENAPVFDLAGRLLGVADLIEEATGTVLESDGAHHREIDHHREDNEREERFENAGLAVTRFTAQDHRDRPGLLRRIVAARGRGRRSSTRDWTLEPPAWWWSWEPGRRYWPR